MSNGIVIILAAGRSTRWRGNITYSSKHFVPIWGDPLINRLVYQAFGKSATANGGEFPLVLGNTKELLEYKNSMDPKQRTICGSILSVGPQWRNQTTVLCGDVVFSSEAMDKIFWCHNTGAFQFFSDETANELFGFTFNRRNYEQVTDALLDAIKASGRLWNLFRAVNGFNQNDHITKSEYLYRFNDYTRDFDSMKDYLKWCAEHPDPIAT